MGRLKDLTGRRFGKLVVIKRTDNKKSWTMFECACDCGKEIVTYSTHLIRGNVESCGCNKPKGCRVYNWKGCGEITGDLWDHISRSGSRSDRRKRREAIKFEVTIEEAWDLFLKQKRKCALSGVELSFENKARTASLDRIDSDKDYILDNVQWVHKDINIMKNVFSQEYFIETCKRIAGQYAHDFPYHRGIRGGFLTKEPSKRTKEVIALIEDKHE